jgi:hypothetical protein
MLSLDSIRRSPAVLFTAFLILAGVHAARASSILVVGNTNFGITLAPEIRNAVDISAGRDHNLALTADGHVVGWGYDGNHRATPPADLSGVVAISAGTYHSLALRADGSVISWGFGGEELTKIPKGVSNVVAIAAGGFHNLALRADGTMVSWGHRGNQRTRVVGYYKGVVAIAAGRDHNLALREDGTVSAWGLNDEGQTSVPRGLSNVVAVAAGGAHSVALLADGHVVAWGSNKSGQRAVPPDLGGVVAIAAGHLHTLALLEDGTVAGWGDNSAGQITFPNDLRNVIAISAGGLHSTLLIGSTGRILSYPTTETVMPGGSARFDVSAVGEGALSFRWNFNGAPIVDQAPVAGSQTASLTVSPAGRPQAGLYSVDVYDGGELIGRAEAALVVRRITRVKPPQVMHDGHVRLVFGDRDGFPLSQPDLPRYEVQVSTDLVHWTSVTGAILLVDGQLQVDDQPGDSARFYRVVER